MIDVTIATGDPRIPDFRPEEAARRLKAYNAAAYELPTQGLLARLHALAPFTVKFVDGEWSDPQLPPEWEAMRSELMETHGRLLAHLRRTILAEYEPLLVDPEQGKD